MKNCKKLGVLLLALIMVTTSGVMSFADGDAAAPTDGTTTGTAAEGTDETAAGSEQDDEQTETQDTETPAHNPLDCKTCKGKGQIAQPADMTPYEKAYEEFEILAVQDNSKSTNENALEYLKNQGVDITEEFAHKYAEYMVDAGDNAWVIDLIVNHRPGYKYWVDFEYTDPDRKEESAIESLKKHAPVAPVKTADYADCSDCENGTIPCTGEFDEGVLTADNGADGGILTHTCAVCGATYTSTIDAADVSVALAKNLEVTGFTASASGTRPGGKINFAMTVENNGKFPVDGVKVTLKLAEGLELTGEKVWVDHGDEKINISGSEIEVTLGTIAMLSEQEIRVYVKLPENAVVGTTYDNALTLETATMNDTPLTLPEEYKASIHVNKYKERTIAVTGHKMGYWYVANDITSKGAVESIQHLGSLDDIEGDIFRFENFDSRFTAPHYGQTVINNPTQKIWKCVGFVPLSYGNATPGIEVLDDYVFTEGTVSDAVEYVKRNDGILYGDIVTDAQLKKWEGLKKGDIYLMAVWYVPEKPIKLITYKDLSITNVALPAAEVTSSGITVECTEAQGWSQTEQCYKANLLVTIDRNAPDEKAHVNLSEALEKAAEKFNEDPNVEPGDILEYSLTIKDISGKEYTYVGGSGIIATVNMNEGNETSWKGFDGFDLSKYTNEEFSAYARRIDNAPLRALGLNSKEKLSDESIGAALRGLGYGKDGQSSADITKEYLGNYYLDYINRGREETAESFEDLTNREFATLTTGTTGEAVPETCKPVVEALYYFYYGRVLTFNGKSIYSQMNNIYNYRQMDGNVEELPEDKRPELETAIPAAMEGTPYQFKVKVAGEEANNGFQNTKFAFRIEFDLKATKPTPTPTPTPTPDPTPTPTPDPTPEPDPTPDPQPLPPDDPLEEPDKPTVDPQPLPPDDPLIEDEDPKQPLPEDDHLEDPDQPKTGDESDLALWLGMMILASGAVVTMRVKRKKED